MVSPVLVTSLSQRPAQLTFWDGHEDAAVAGVQSRVKLDLLKYDTQTDYTELGHIGHENSWKFMKIHEKSWKFM